MYWTTDCGSRGVSTRPRYKHALFPQTPFGYGTRCRHRLDICRVSGLLKRTAKINFAANTRTEVKSETFLLENGGLLTLNPCPR